MKNDTRVTGDFAEIGFHFGLGFICALSVWAFVILLLAIGMKFISSL